MPSTPSPKRVKQCVGDDVATGSPYRVTPASNNPYKAHLVSADDIEQNKENVGKNLHGKDGYETQQDDEQTSPSGNGTAGLMGSDFGSPRMSARSPKPERAGATYAATGGYNALKSFNGQVYSGMAVGGSHVWNYEPGTWTETKVEPDLWQIDFETIKRREKNAPAGSGAPVGTEYHWVIVAHQYVKKLDANSYSTHLVGSKYKLAHKNASSNRWSVATVKAQRERELGLLDDAKRRVEGLPPVLANEKVKADKQEKGQQKLDSLFSRAAVPKGGQPHADDGDKKRKRDD